MAAPELHGASHASQCASRTASDLDRSERSRAAANGTIASSGVASTKHRDLHALSRYAAE
eukprot:scaffold3236_cov138-Isochrysis_galbana.AAC.1